MVFAPGPACSSEPRARRSAKGRAAPACSARARRRGAAASEAPRGSRARAAGPRARARGAPRNPARRRHPRTMRFTADLAVHAAQRMNPLGEREVILRATKLP